MDGIINIYKEKGFTSHDVVAKMRGILKMKKIGHTGTLDPDATGVLPVCLGKGTKLCDMLTDKHKTYRAVMLLGKITDTQDITGTVLQEQDVTVTEEEVQTACKKFVGEISQIPPMYSALKVNGKKLYELARAGKTVERKPRQVEILTLTIEEIQLPRVTFTVECSKGTYIRTLCQDIGEELGCGACMEKLQRICVGNFKIEDALTLKEVENRVADGTIEQYVQRVDAVFTQYPAVKMPVILDKLVHNGNAIPEEAMDFTDISLLKRQPIKVYDSQNQFIGIYDYQEKYRCFKPLKMFFGG
jgi:tRNA pseudouridine55 synthase